VVHAILEDKFAPIKMQYYKARALYCTSIIEVLCKNPRIFDELNYETVFSDLQKMSLRLCARKVEKMRDCLECNVNPKAFS
ncbi:hypothetical protein MKW94_008430, partial [Papaver nudicaule]|nr:hypothetical protein [Papaver nudicaule]